jgi:hypothetical protein
VSSFRQKLKHAFAVDPPGPAEPDAAQQQVVDAFCRWIARRHLTTPGLMFMEITRPLNWIAAQAGHFFSPGLWMVAPEQVHRKYRTFVGYLEHRGSIEYIARRIEHFEHEYEKQQRGRNAPVDDDGEGPA